MERVKKILDEDNKIVGQIDKLTEELKEVDPEGYKQVFEKKSGKLSPDVEQMLNVMPETYFKDEKAEVDVVAPKEVDESTTERINKLLDDISKMADENAENIMKKK